MGQETSKSVSSITIDGLIGGIKQLDRRAQVDPIFQNIRSTYTYSEIKFLIKVLEESKGKDAKIEELKKEFEKEQGGNMQRILELEQNLPSCSFCNPEERRDELVESFKKQINHLSHQLSTARTYQTNREHELEEELKRLHKHMTEIEEPNEELQVEMEKDKATIYHLKQQLEDWKCCFEDAEVKLNEREVIIREFEDQEIQAKKLNKRTHSLDENVRVCNPQRNPFVESSETIYEHIRTPQKHPQVEFASPRWENCRRVLSPVRKPQVKPEVPARNSTVLQQNYLKLEANQTILRLKNEIKAAEDNFQRCLQELMMTRRQLKVTEENDQQKMLNIESNHLETIEKLKRGYESELRGKRVMIEELEDRLRTQSPKSENSKRKVEKTEEFRRQLNLMNEIALDMVSEDHETYAKEHETLCSKIIDLECQLAARNQKIEELKAKKHTRRTHTPEANVQLLTNELLKTKSKMEVMMDAHHKEMLKMKTEHAETIKQVFEKIAELQGGKQPNLEQELLTAQSEQQKEAPEDPAKLKKEMFKKAAESESSGDSEWSYMSSNDAISE